MRPHSTGFSNTFNASVTPETVPSGPMSATTRYFDRLETPPTGPASLSNNPCHQSVSTWLPVRRFFDIPPAACSAVLPRLVSQTALLGQGAASARPLPPSLWRPVSGDRGRHNAVPGRRTAGSPASSRTRSRRGSAPVFSRSCRIWVRVMVQMCTVPFSMPC